MLVISILIHPLSPESSLSYIRMVVVPMRRFVHCIYVGSSNYLAVSRSHSCISVIHPFRCLLLIVVCKIRFVLPLIFLNGFALLWVTLYSTGII